FFFSSRRRHTRFSRDWSSDVCSSDLTVVYLHGFYRTIKLSVPQVSGRTPRYPPPDRMCTMQLPISAAGQAGQVPTLNASEIPHRSEERRVGKEGRSPWSTPHRTTTHA